MKHKYFIKEIKVLKKVNALGEPLEYQTSYVICRTSGWFWLPSLFTEYLWVASVSEAIGKMHDSERVEVDWVHWVPGERFRYKEQAEYFLRKMKHFPNDFYINVK